MADISVLSKRTFCFFHPDVNNSEAMQKAMNNREHNQPLPGSFTTKALPFQAQTAPDWIVDTPLFKLAEKDGDIFVVPTPSASVAVGKPTPVPDTSAQIDLNGMTKAQLVGHAAEVHGLELDPAAKKDELISSIAAAQKAS